ncbi:MAG: ATP-binding protein [Chitinophagaceae bacterium]|nr:ATP-binding protein [Chitinophagaceae bacterium]
MILTRFQYREFQDSPKYWELDSVELQNVNLIVGKNASGKTRVLNVIKGLANLLFNSPKITFQNGYYNTRFDLSQGTIEFEVEIKDGVVEKERLSIDGEQYIIRGSEGSGQIKNIKTKENIDFKIPKDELMSGRRDEIQFPFLDSLYNWASLVRKFRFTLEQQKNTLALLDSNSPKPKDFNLRDTDKVLAVFKDGLKKHSTRFTSQIIEDFNRVGFDITEIDLGQMISISVEVSAPGTSINGLRIKERDRNGMTDQYAMSDGMFRALSLVIHFVYYDFEKLSGCILIDDIGEGLDFERATNLIKLLIEKTGKTSVQLIMSSNDKFIMNNTDLKYWQIISREGGRVHMYNQKNSPEAFGDFKFTGLNNFDFFTSEFFKTGFKIESEEK